MQRSKTRYLLAPSGEINQAAETFIGALGSINRKYLRENLQNVAIQSDALKAIDQALRYYE